jgi:hypothetical protein
LYLHRWLETGRRLHCLGFTAAVCLSITAGYSHVLIYELIFIGIYFLLLLCNTKKQDSLRHLINGRFAVHLGISIGLGICISANFLTSSLILLDDAQREEIPFSDLYRQTGRLPAKSLTTLIFPDFYGNPAGGGIVFTPREDAAQTYNNYHELCIYAGIVPLFLILCCLAGLRQRRFALFYLSTGIVTLAMAMGSVLYYPLAKYVIGLNYSSPTRILYLTGFCFAVLSAVGADLLLSPAEKKTRNLTLALWTLLLLSAIGLAFFAQSEPGARWAAGTVDEAYWKQDFQVLSQHFAFTSSAVLYPLLFTGASFLLLCAALWVKSDRQRSRCIALSIVILAVDLISFGRTYNTATPAELAFPDTGVTRFLQRDKSAFRVVGIGFFLHNFLVPFGQQDVGGYASFYPKRYGEYLHLSQEGPAAPMPDRYYRWTMFHRYGSPLLNLLNTKYVLTSPSAKPDTADLKAVYQGEVQVFENRSAFPRAFIVHAYQLCPDRKSAFEAVGSYRQADFASRVVLESPPPAVYADQAPTPAGPGRRRVERIAVRTNHVEIDVETDRKGFLVISDSYHPHWQATVDGEAVEILRANYIMQAIPLAQGRHKVRLQFRSRMLTAGILFTAAGWLVLAGLLVACCTAATRCKRTPAASAKPVADRTYPGN